MTYFEFDKNISQTQNIIPIDNFRIKLNFVNIFYLQ
jgi:hypothetical protein